MFRMLKNVPKSLKIKVTTDRPTDIVTYIRVILNSYEKNPVMIKKRICLPRPFGLVYPLDSAGIPAAFWRAVGLQPAAAPR